MSKKISVFMFMAMSLSIFLDTSVSQAAFGISPPWIKSAILLPGMTYEQVVNLSRSDTEKDMKATIVFNGDEELVKWISIPNQNNLVLKRGQAILPMKVTVNVPDTAELKRYMGSIYITLKPVEKDENLGGAQVAIGLGANISIDITVTDQLITDYKIQSASVVPQRQGDPFAVSVKVRNTGNTTVNNLEGSINIYRSAVADELVKSLEFLPLEEPIAFNESRELKMAYNDFMLTLGGYSIMIQASKNGEVVYENLQRYTIGEDPVTVVTPDDVIIVPVEEGEADLNGASTNGVRNGFYGTTTNVIYLLFGLTAIVIGLIAYRGRK